MQFAKQYYSALNRAAVGPTPPLDTYPAASAYSLRKLRTAYSGPCIRVRRSSDNTEQDINFSGDLLDTAALLSFVGAGNGFVRTWYDQGSQAVNLENSTLAQQPKIVNAGSLYLGANGKPYIDFNGQFLANESGVSIIPAAANPSLTMFLAVESQYFALYRGTGSGDWSVRLVYQSGLTARFGTIGGSLAEAVASVTNNGPKLVTGRLIGGASASGYYEADGVPVSTSGSIFGYRISSGVNFRFGLNVLNSGIPQKVFEYILYLSDQTSNQSAIQSEINGFYNLY